MCLLLQQQHKSNNTHVAKKSKILKVLMLCSDMRANGRSMESFVIKTRVKMAGN